MILAVLVMIEYLEVDFMNQYCNIEQNREKLRLCELTIELSSLPT